MVVRLQPARRGGRGSGGPFLQGEGKPVIGETKERWMTLCEQAAVEQDGKRLLDLIEEINRLLDEKRQRLATCGSSDAKSA